MISFDRRRAYVLHTRPLRETSVIAELVVEGEGRIACVHRKVRGMTARPFVRYAASVRGRGELPTLTQLEECGLVSLSRTNLLDGLYLNELVLRLLPGQYHAPELWGSYDESLRGLAAGDEHASRRFELHLLGMAGLQFDGGVCERLDDGAWYRFAADQAPEPSARPSDGGSPDHVRGATLRALARGLPADCPPEVHEEAARLLRHFIGRQSGGRAMRTEALRGGIRQRGN